MSNKKTSRSRPVSLVLMALLISPTQLFGDTQVSEPDGTAKVRGFVLDPNQARINNAIVRIEGESSRREAKTNEEGEYEFVVSPGVYRITALVPAYYPYRRAAIRLRCCSVRTVNIAPVLRMLSIGIEVTEKEVREPMTTAPPPRYDYYFPPKPADAALDVFVRFLDRKADTNYVEYSEAAVSYDTLTIYADRVRIDKKRTLLLEAEGKVIVENGDQRVFAKRATVDLNARSVIIAQDF